jgi:PKD repeat protein
MPAGYQDLFLEQGTTFSTQLTLDDVNGYFYDLNGFTVRSQARRSYYSANAAITFETSVVDPASGIIQLFASASATANVPSGKLVYDVLLTDTDTNVVSRVLEGQIIVSPSATK